jgi:hypothetical protein
MHRALLGLAGVVLGVSLLSAGCGSDKPETDGGAINRLARDYVHALVNGDGEAAYALLTDQGQATCRAGDFQLYAARLKASLAMDRRDRQGTQE